MLRFTTGNLLDAEVEALVNTVNSVGVMGKGIALMFKEGFPENYKAYEAACKSGLVRPGRMFVTLVPGLIGPRWIVNFPTKKHWRNPSKLEWIEEGLRDLRSVIAEKKIRSIAIPPLGSGNGGLDWNDVRPLIERELGEIVGLDAIVYEPTREYQNVAKNQGVEKLTPARALIAEMIRRYSVLGFECSILEAQKLAWFMQRIVEKLGLANPLKLDFKPKRYGPYAPQLTHVLTALDGSYLHCEKRVTDAVPTDILRFDESKRNAVAEYFKGDGQRYAPVIDVADELIDGYQSPLGMEALATVDWLILNVGADHTLHGIRAALGRWPDGENSAERKQRLFNDKLLSACLTTLTQFNSDPRCD